MVIEVVVVLVQFIFSLLAIKITRFTIIFPIALHSRLFIYTHTHTHKQSYFTLIFSVLHILLHIYYSTHVSTIYRLSNYLLSFMYICYQLSTE